MDPAGLAAALTQTTSPQAEPRKAAEAYLTQLSLQPGYGVALLQLAAVPTVDDGTRLAASVAFKNHVKFQWEPPEEEAGAPLPPSLGPEEKEALKARLVGVLVAQPAKVQAQLGEALALMAATDFPDRWPGLLPELLACLGSGELSVVNGVLATADTIFRRFRDAYKTVGLVKDINYVLGIFVQPLLALLMSLGSRLAGADGAQPETARALLTAVLHICRIFFSLNFVELPEVFEDTMGDWMAEFLKYLAYSNPALVNADASKESVVDQVKAAICENANLYVEKNETEFAPFLNDFAMAIWGLLLTVGAEASKDALATEGIRFLTTVVGGVHAALFGEEKALRAVLENVVIPNLRFREADEELFAENYVEYIRRDMEGSDTDTRRRMACELLKALTARFQRPVTDAVMGYVTLLLAEHAAAPEAAWQAKDCAIYLVVALTVRGKTEAKGATALNELVSVGDFFAAHILPELRAPPHVGAPVLKADALKFLTTFRAHLPKPLCLELLPALAALLTAQANVVHSYAALAVERLVSAREGANPRFSAAELAPLREALLSGLFHALTLPESGENEYVMRAVMRLLAALGPEARPVADQCAQHLAAMLAAQAANPRNPSFAHYLFEALAALVRCSASDADAAMRLEALLLPPFQEVLRADVQEFAPYVFQLLALLVEQRPPPLPAAYLLIFPPLLSPVLWERPGNVPALVRLLQAYLSRAPAQVVGGGHLTGVLGVFQKLNASRAHDHEGFFVLNALVESLDAAAWAPHMPTLWDLLLRRLYHSRTPKYARAFAVFFALLVARMGPAWAAAGLEGVQAGVLLSLLEHVWLPALAGVQGDTERKLAAVAATKLLTDCPALAAPEVAPLWGRLLEAAVTLLAEAPDDAGPPDEEEEAAAGAGAGGGVYARLLNAARPETDPLPDVPSAPALLATSLGRFSQAQPGWLAPRVAASLGPASAASLASICAAAGVTLA